MGRKTMQHHHVAASVVPPDRLLFYLHLTTSGSSSSPRRCDPLAIANPPNETGQIPTGNPGRPRLFRTTDIQIVLMRWCCGRDRVSKDQTTDIADMRQNQFTKENFKHPNVGCHPGPVDDNPEVFEHPDRRLATLDPRLRLPSDSGWQYLP